jgi:hypothetical protein
MTDELNTRQIWQSISSAIGVELREATTIRGSSGQDHPVQAPHQQKLLVADLRSFLSLTGFVNTSPKDPVKLLAHSIATSLVGYSSQRGY